MGACSLCQVTSSRAGRAGAERARRELWGKDPRGGRGIVWGQPLGGITETMPKSRNSIQSKMDSHWMLLKDRSFPNIWKAKSISMKAGKWGHRASLTSQKNVCCYNCKWTVGNLTPPVQGAKQITGLLDLRVKTIHAFLAWVESQLPWAVYSPGNSTAHGDTWLLCPVICASLSLFPSSNCEGEPPNIIAVAALISVNFRVKEQLVGYSTSDSRRL